MFCKHFHSFLWFCCEFQPVTVILWDPEVASATTPVVSVAAMTMWSTDAVMHVRLIILTLPAVRAAEPATAVLMGPALPSVTW